MSSPDTLPKLSTESVQYANKVLEEMQKESDRAAAILLGAELDDTLNQILTKHLLPPRPKIESAPLARTFASRIELAYRLGLLHPVYHHELHLVKDVRNEFAHKTLGVSFDSPKVAALTLKFVSSKAMDAFILEKAKSQPELKLLLNQNSRERFISAGAILLHRLTAINEQVKQVSISTGRLH